MNKTKKSGGGGKEKDLTKSLANDMVAEFTCTPTGQSRASKKEEGGGPKLRQQKREKAEKVEPGALRRTTNNPISSVQTTFMQIPVNVELRSIM